MSYKNNEYKQLNAMLDSYKYEDIFKAIYIYENGETDEKTLEKIYRNYMKNDVLTGLLNPEI
ncbi:MULTISPECIES: hypothetical protein [Staphylococcaceae]|uniref:hypothetical protein n=1 Tax=Staphylococcaceae TaxID=90964 RepID=UPI000DE3BEE3|nr:MULTISPECIES: hypothetical protein [Staphylococcaceae]HBU9598950.1 hypothetical protein [Staphylococcus pseudintermedius]MBO3063853.1 hypothetical protein [Mammaliicoccus fleurettii]MCE5086061.1 hypothetical protein [Mammaliicoccus sciuri]HBU9601450.1 hypothetical protein [Staphylococcus pseudintermedius]HBU9603887.1 hypothetical protein [Staphylococcus pseudintermedius]